MKPISRQAWLRDPERSRRASAADPRPVEAAVLSREADTMRDMVRQYVAQKSAEDTQEDEAFLDDDEFMLEEEAPPLSDYQLAELAADIQADEQLRADQGEADLVAQPREERSDESGSEEPEQNPISTVT